jgi:hypothetical protein
MKTIEIIKGNQSPASASEGARVGPDLFARWLISAAKGRAVRLRPRKSTASAVEL